MWRFLMPGWLAQWSRSTRRAVKTKGELCPACGGRMGERRGRLDLPVNGERIAVDGASHLQCTRCKESVLRFDEARHLRERAFEIYRKRHGLLGSDEIRSIRERLGLTQAALARLLRLGGNTISRWESGRNVQSGSMDVLLRLLRDVPGSLEYVRGLVV